MVPMYFSRHNEPTDMQRDLLGLHLNSRDLDPILEYKLILLGSTCICFDASRRAEHYDVRFCPLEFSVQKLFANPFLPPKRYFDLP